MQDRVCLKAVGDVMLGDFPLTLGFGVKSTIKSNVNINLFSKVMNYLKESDLCFGNLETVLSDFSLNPFDIKSSQMRGAPSSVKLLKDAGFSVMSVANNHAMQHGPEAFIETINKLAENGISPIGVVGPSGKASPYFITIKNISFCFLAYSGVHEKYCSDILYAHTNSFNILDDVRRCRQHCDIVIVSLHWGDEFVQVPSQEQLALGRSIIDAGASLIIGHHPHILQGIEKYNNGLIAYSLGNFVFDFWQNNLRKSIILNCVFSKKGIDAYSIAPVFIVSNYMPELLSGNKCHEIQRLIDTLSAEINTIRIGDLKKSRQYAINVKLNLLRNKIENRLYFIRNFFRYDSWVIKQSLNNFFSERLKKNN